MDKQLGNLRITMCFIDPAQAGQAEDDMFSRGMRSRTIFRMYQITKEQAADYSARFLRDNMLDNRDKYQTEVTWTATEYI